jgi:hypothetical protein
MPSMSNLSPDQINARHEKAVYHCRACRVESGLHWYRGTSCPVCSKPECIQFCDREWDQALQEIAERDQDQ